MKEKVRQDDLTVEDNPPWADGLKRIYSAVLNEPLPDIFGELLEKLDQADLNEAEKKHDYQDE